MGETISKNTTKFDIMDKNVGEVLGLKKDEAISLLEAQGLTRILI